MTYIITSRRWQEQPPWDARISPLVYEWSPRWFAIGGDRANRLSRAYGPSGSALRVAANAAGRVWSVEKATQTAPNIANSLDAFVPLGTEVAIFLVGAFATDNSNGNGFMGNESSNVGFQIYLPFVNGTTYWRWSSGGDNELTVGGLTFRQTDVFAFTRGPRGSEIWQNGIRVANNGSQLSSSRLTSSNAVRFGSQAITPTATDGCQLSGVLTLDRQPTEDFLADATRRPAHFWGTACAPVTRRIYIGLTAGATFADGAGVSIGASHGASTATPLLTSAGQSVAPSQAAGVATRLMTAPAQSTGAAASALVGTLSARADSSAFGAATAAAVSLAQVAGEATATAPGGSSAAAQAQASALGTGASAGVSVVAGTADALIEGQSIATAVGSSYGAATAAMLRSGDAFSVGQGYACSVALVSSVADGQSVSVSSISGSAATFNLAAALASSTSSGAAVIWTAPPESAIGGGGGWPVDDEYYHPKRERSSIERIKDILDEVDEEIREAVSGEPLAEVLRSPVDVAAVAGRMTPKRTPASAALDLNEEDDDFLLLSF